MSEPKEKIPVLIRLLRTVDSQFGHVIFNSLAAVKLVFITESSPWYFSYWVLFGGVLLRARLGRSFLRKSSDL